ncbi:MAG: hypothetical protein JSS16_05435 [Proteobacteria bacterium]|uniref:hypothetical protein n=1 Tax=Rudaea sp. TaxID=2136325 RepID=UPI001D4D442D|nr:hypothetical protein [Pseudomonadota bacterium]MBS0566898.1 hypothetical protein [Pseudomonadota bacterium]
MSYWRWFNRPHHPFARALIGVLGIVLLGGILAVGLLALVAFAVIGTIVALVRAFARAGAARTTPSRHANVIEGEFVVLPSRTASVEQ